MPPSAFCIHIPVAMLCAWLCQIVQSPHCLWLQVQPLADLGGMLGPCSGSLENSVKFHLVQEFYDLLKENPRATSKL
jgi:hypothetical protein